MLFHNFEKERESEGSEILASLWWCDIKILQRKLGVSNKRKILNRPDVTFSWTTVKKAGATFHNPTIHRIVSESCLTLCTARNERAGQPSASNLLCSSLDTLHASQAEKKLFESKALVKGCAISGCLWGQHPCSIRSVLGGGTVQLELCAAGWPSSQRARIPALRRRGWDQLREMWE